MTKIREVKIYTPDYTQWWSATLIFVHEDGHEKVLSISSRQKMVQFRRAVEKLPVMLRRRVRAQVGRLPTDQELTKPW